MTYTMSPQMVAILYREEGFRSHPYLDSRGIESIGFGRNLRDVGITLGEAQYLAANDRANAAIACATSIPFFGQLDQVRQDVVVNLCFNMGITKLLTFKDTLAAMSRKDFDAAANHLLDSLAEQQEPNRIKELAGILRSGVYDGLSSVD